MVTNVYVDVDGVLNALHARPGTGGWDPSGHRTFKANGFTMTFHTGLIDKMRELEAMPGVAMYWLTSWGVEAPSLLSAHFGIGADWEVVPNTEFAFSRWWKYDDIRDHIANTEPHAVVWIDDDHRHYRINPVQVLETSEAVMIVSPKLQVGLTVQDMKNVLEFVSSRTKEA